MFKNTRFFIRLLALRSSLLSFFGASAALRRRYATGSLFVQSLCSFTVPFGVRSYLGAAPLRYGLRPPFASLGQILVMRLKCREQSGMD